MLEPLEIGDQLEITRLLYLYARAIDTKELGLLERVFTPDAYIEYNTAGGMRGSFPEIARWLGAVLPSFKATQHTISNPLIELDGDAARSTCYLQAAHVQVRRDGSESYALQHATYTDRHVRTDAGWRIRRRVLDNVHVVGEFLGPDRVRLFPEPE
jgi:hypothetical protein